MEVKLGVCVLAGVAQPIPPFKEITFCNLSLPAAVWEPQQLESQPPRQRHRQEQQETSICWRIVHLYTSSFLICSVPSQRSSNYRLQRLCMFDFNITDLFNRSNVSPTMKLSSRGNGHLGFAVSSDSCPLCENSGGRRWSSRQETAGNPPQPDFNLCATICRSVGSKARRRGFWTVRFLPKTSWMFAGFPQLSSGVAGLLFPLGLNVRATLLMQNRWPVGSGPSSNTWPRCPSH